MPPFTLWNYLWRALGMALRAYREGRLSASPRRWLIDLRHLYGVMRGRLRDDVAEADPLLGVTTASGAPVSLADWRARITAESRAELQTFLGSSSRLILPRADRPLVSVVIVLFNRAELTLRCLRSLERTSGAVPIEVILVNNASTDETPALLAQIGGTTIVQFDENRGFLLGCNVGSRSASGQYILLLNSDTELLADTLAAAVEVLQTDDSIGAVGARLVLPDGSLQEAGSIIWRDGSCLGYGRGEDPGAPQYSFARDVDFCSAAFLLTPRAVFERLGGFDAIYVPAYYEDTDYCARLWQAGYSVRYDPRIIVRHYEFGSSCTSQDAITQQLAHRSLFVSRHHKWLEAQREFAPDAELDARVHSANRRRILVFDDRVPHTALGSGFPRALELIRTLVALGWEVTLYPLWIKDEPWPEVYQELPRSVEVMTGWGPERVPAFMAERASFYRIVLVSRSHNLDRLSDVLGPPTAWFPETRIIFDAEALQVSREAMRRRIDGVALSETDLEREIDNELRDVAGMDAVITVSALEGERLARAGRPVHVITHQVRPNPGSRSFSSRLGFLFVGAFSEHSPNADSILWFCDQVFPRLRSRLRDAAVTIAGHAPPRRVMALRGYGVDVRQDVQDLSPLYDAARVVIAPTRFAAGIPLKVIHAAAAGVPVVCTGILGRQLGWHKGIELLIADGAEEFTEACTMLHDNETLWRSLREAALARVARDHSPESFSAAVARCLEQTLAADPLAAAHAP
jgi:O-antigen biosynthesis protein